MTWDDTAKSFSKGNHPRGFDVCFMDKELKACKVLARYGHEVYLLSEFCARDNDKKQRVCGETITDNRMLELKETDTNIQKNYKKAKRQAQDVFLCIKGDMTKERAIERIKGIIKSMKQGNEDKIDFAGNVYLYFEKQDELYLYIFDDNGDCEESDPKKSIPPDISGGRATEVHCNNGNGASDSISILPSS